MLRRIAPPARRSVLRRQRGRGDWGSGRGPRARPQPSSRQQRRVEGRDACRRARSSRHSDAARWDRATISVRRTHGCGGRWRTRWSSEPRASTHCERGAGRLCPSHGRLRCLHGCDTRAAAAHGDALARSPRPGSAHGGRGRCAVGAGRRPPAAPTDPGGRPHVDRVPRSATSPTQWGVAWVGGGRHDPERQSDLRLVLERHGAQQHVARVEQRRPHRLEPAGALRARRPRRMDPHPGGELMEERSQLGLGGVNIQCCSWPVHRGIRRSAPAGGTRRSGALTALDALRHLLARRRSAPAGGTRRSGALTALDALRHLLARRRDETRPLGCEQRQLRHQ